MAITLTPSATVEVKRLIEKENAPGLGLRLGVKGGGCSGFNYVLGFDSQKEGDTIFEVENFKVFIDPKSFLYLNGTQLDFQDGLQGKGFLFKNPNAARTCGCGESFSA